MALKKNLPSYKKRLSLGFLTVSLISCSALGQWWYDRLDIYLANYFFKYADFTNEQKSYIRSVTKEYLEWNSTSEIPKYRSLIIKIRDLDETTATKDIRSIFKEGEALFEASNNFFTPHMVKFCRTVTDKQIEEVNLFFQKRIERWTESLKESKNLSQEESITESVQRLAKFLGVKLDDKQLKTIRDLAKEIKEEDTSSIERQDTWNKELITILRKRDSENYNFLLSDHLNSLLDSEQRGNREAVYHEIIATTIASLNEAQRKKFKKRLNVFVSSLDKIIRNHN
ncbi:MAG: DUF6279 family lipoprotein [SAR86 cluster bacterium]|nr:DUF6279 family lipoprotein [SAR86 cluster bacterium]